MLLSYCYVPRYKVWDTHQLFYLPHLNYERHRGVKLCVVIIHVCSGANINAGTVLPTFIFPGKLDSNDHFAIEIMRKTILGKEHIEYVDMYIKNSNYYGDQKRIKIYTDYLSLSRLADLYIGMIVVAGGMTFWIWLQFVRCSLLCDSWKRWCPIIAICKPLLGLKLGGCACVEYITQNMNDTQSFVESFEAMIMIISCREVYKSMEY